MEKLKLSGAFFTVLVVVVSFCGCQIVDEPIAIDNLPTARVKMAEPPVLVADESSQEMGNRFLEAQEGDGGAVEDALKWSAKYDELLTKNERLGEKNHAMVLETSDLKQKMEKLQDELDRTKMELAEANDFLQEMHQELTKWKADVLGFRDEMRGAQSTQLEALSKILTILGAEPVVSENAEN